MDFDVELKKILKNYEIFLEEQPAENAELFEQGLTTDKKK